MLLLNHRKAATVTRNPYIPQMNGDGIKKGRTVKENPLRGNPLRGNPLRGNPLSMKGAAKPFGRHFDFPVSFGDTKVTDCHT